MSDETQDTEAVEAEAQAAEDAARDMEHAEAEDADEAEAAAEADTDAPAEPADVDDPAAQVQDLQDKLLRTMAELENTRRIASREKQDAGKYAVTNFARDILRVADNLGFAMMSVSEDARKADPNLENLYVGIDMTMKELLNVFESHGIKPVPAEGQPFDHNKHEAVQQVEDPDVPENTIKQVMRQGFTIQDRLLRPAQVIVSAGGPKPEKANGGDAGDEGESEADGDAQGGTDGQRAYEPGPGDTGHKVDQET